MPEFRLRPWDPTSPAHRNNPPALGWLQELRRNNPEYVWEAWHERGQSTPQNNPVSFDWRYLTKSRNNPAAARMIFK